VRLNPSARGASTKRDGFLRFLRFGTLPAICLAWLPDGPAAGSGKKTMTSINLSQIAASLIAALAATTLFVSAAVGPAAQFI
jgi:hypothetical protein